MKTMIIALLMLFLINAVGCKDAADKAGFVDMPVTQPDETPGQDSPAEPVILADHSYRYDEPSGMYGSRPTYEECKYIGENWVVGINETWAFNSYEPGYTLYLRFDKDGVKRMDLPFFNTFTVDQAGYCIFNINNAYDLDSTEWQLTGEIFTK